MLLVEIFERQVGSGDEPIALEPADIARQRL
jgi:hypothetical protein